MKKFIVLACMAVMVFAVPSASALSILDIQNGGGSIQIGDKVFSDFTVSVSGSTDANASNINVFGSQVGDTVFLNFQGPMGTTSLADIGLTYSVLSLGGAIYAIDQYFSLSVTGDGGNIIIGETVFDQQGGNNVAQSTVSFFNLVPDINDPPGEVKQGDQLVVDPALYSLYVVKDIFLQAFNKPTGGGFVGATILTQSFHQTVIPEPGTMMLLGSGLVGLAGWGRKKFRK
jgi:hypothetical protein